MAVGRAFAVGLPQGIAEPHDAARIGAMAEPEGVAELVHRLLQCAAAKALVVGVEMEPEQRDDAGSSARLGDAKDKVQIAGVQIDVGDGEHALGPDRKRQAEQGVGMELTALAICASLAMAAATVCAFIYAVKKDYFRDIEETKYQVFWSDLDEEEPNPHGSGPKEARK